MRLYIGKVYKINNNMVSIVLDNNTTIEDIQLTSNCKIELNNTIVCLVDNIRNIKIAINTIEV